MGRGYGGRDEMRGHILMNNTMKINGIEMKTNGINQVKTMYFWGNIMKFIYGAGRVKTRDRPLTFAYGHTT